MKKLKLLPISFLALTLFLDSCVDNSSEPNQLQKDIAAIDSYLQANNITTALEDITGVRYTIDSLGSGFTPRLNDKVTFEYTGKLLNGTVFDPGPKLTNYLITNLIVGFQIALPQIPNGSKATLYIPSVYAYGSTVKPGIPANSSLIFHIKIKSIVVTTAEKNQRNLDTLAIDDYLDNAAIANVVKDTSGLRYTIDQTGSGTPPSWFHRVYITYSGFLITNNTKGAKFFEGSNEPSNTTDSRVVNFIRGFQMGLQKMQKGGKATFYVPSVLGFGDKAISGALVPIPANSNLIFEVELKDVLSP